MNILVLGAGEKAADYHANPSSICNRDSVFIGENPRIVCVDRRPLWSVDVIADLDNKDWRTRVVSLAPDLYDLIIAEHIAEHLTDRIGFLKNCYGLLGYEKLLILEVPNWCHVLAHGNLEHKSTWSRMSFDGYVVQDFFRVERVKYRWTNPISFRNHYFPTEWLGRQVDRFTREVSGLRFYLRAK